MSKCHQQLQGHLRMVPANGQEFRTVALSLLLLLLVQYKAE
jgi:hypothetical protein